MLSRVVWGALERLAAPRCVAFFAPASLVARLNAARGTGNARMVGNVTLGEAETYGRNPGRTV